MVEGHERIELSDLRTLTTDLKRSTFPPSSHWIPIPDKYLESTSGGASTSSNIRAPSIAYTSGASTGGTWFGHFHPHGGSDTSPTTGQDSQPSPGRGVHEHLGASRRHASYSEGALPTYKYLRPWIFRSLVNPWRVFPNGGRRAAHAPFVDATERAWLLAYCREHLAASTASQST